MALCCMRFPWLGSSGMFFNSLHLLSSHSFLRSQIRSNFLQKSLDTWSKPGPVDTGSQSTRSLSFGSLLQFVIIHSLMGLFAWVLSCCPQQTTCSRRICCLRHYFYFPTPFPHSVSCVLMFVGDIGHLFWLFCSFVHLSCVWRIVHLVSPPFTVAEPRNLLSWPWYFATKYMNQAVTTSLPEAQSVKIQQSSLVHGIASSSHGVMLGGSLGAGTVLCLLLEIVTGRTVTKSASVAFPEILSFKSFNKIFFSALMS